jgi:phosphatidylinositol alpha 1,6-mannosyltransferase
VIVHVTDCFHPRLGGIEVQVEELATAQQDNGETVHVITATPAAGGTDRPGHGYPIHRVVARLPWELPVHPRAGVHLGSLFTELRPEVVHVHLGSVSPFAWSAVRCALRCRLPTVVTVHSMWDPVTRGMYRSFDRLVGWGGAPLVVTAVSTAAAELVRLTVPNATATVIPNGIAADQWRTARRSGDEVDDGTVHVVAVGRLAPRKQPITLLQVLHAAGSRLNAEVPLRATVAGTGPALPAMRRYLRKHAMTNVRLVGRLDRGSVHTLLATADLFVNPTVRESFGIATLEARTAGVPVLARAGNGVADFIHHGQEGLLCHSVDDLIDAVVWLARDHPTRRRIRDHNRATIPTHCTWPAVLTAFRRCYDRAAALATPPRGNPPVDHQRG